MPRPAPSRVSLGRPARVSWHHRWVSNPRSPARGSFTKRAVVLALVLAGLMLSVTVPARAWFTQRTQIAELRADVDAAQARVSELQVQQQRWSDPAFVAAQARRRLHFVLPGEVGYVALGAQAQQAGLANAVPADEPWYATLMAAVQRADDRGGE